jgi:8-oxo-dGTP pyrophosphatase MutT (NUDIX family)
MLHGQMILMQSLKVSLYCGRDSFRPYYHGRYQIVELDFGIECSATEVRDGLKDYNNIQIENSEEFRKGVVHAMQNLWHRTYLTVDIGLIRFNALNGYEVLLVRKPNEDRWQLPGGFVNASETFADAAKRELYEETACKAQGEFQYIGDYPITDAGKRSKAGRLKLVYDDSGVLTTVSDSNPRPDQLVEVFRNGKIVKWDSFDVIRARAEL